MHFRKRAAIAMIELLVVLAIIGILLGILLPAVQAVRSASARTGCANTLKQVGVALHSFHDAHGRLPRLPKRARDDPNRRLGWMALILPHMGENGLYQVSLRACQADLNPLHNPPHSGLSTVVPGYVCNAE